MTPTYEELLEGSTLWRKEHKGVTYLLSHHGFRGTGRPNGSGYDFDNHPGAWCFYIIVPREMYPHRWSDFAVIDGKPGPAWSHDWFHGGITWSSKEVSYHPRKGVEVESSKVGCDYNHLWDGESFYPDTYASVQRDAQRAVDALLEANPDRRSGCVQRTAMPR